MSIKEAKLSDFYGALSMKSAEALEKVIMEGRKEHFKRPLRRRL